MEREMTYRKARFQAQGRFEHQEAATLAYQRRLKEAAQLWDRALTLARQGNFLERAAVFQGARADQAQDLTQEFFVRVLEGRYLDRADPERGRFRSFLLSSLKFFVADEEHRNRAHKRGGRALVSLEFSSGEERYQREPAHDETPERIFERGWALSVLERVTGRLRDEFVRHGRPEHFERLKVFLLGQSDAPYSALAREMNKSEGALKVAIHR